MPEQKAPAKITPSSASDYLEVMSKSVFQTGMSWRVVESKWPGTCDAFMGFEVKAVAAMGETQVEELVQDTRIIRNRRKIQAVIDNARRLVELEDEHGSIQNYLRSHGTFASTVKALKKDFKFLGDMGTYFFLHVVGEEVPSHEDWMASRAS